MIAVETRRRASRTSRRMRQYQALSLISPRISPPGDFMFQLSDDEWGNLRSQIVTSRSHGGRRYRPRVFAEQGVAMLSSVLRSKRAVQVNIAIMRAFVRLRELLQSHHELAQKLAEMEMKYDAQFKVVFDAIRKLMEPPVIPRPTIGFRPGSD